MVEAGPGPGGLWAEVRDAIRDAMLRCLEHTELQDLIRLSQQLEPVLDQCTGALREVVDAFCGELQKRSAPIPPRWLALGPQPASPWDYVEPGDDVGVVQN